MDVADWQLTDQAAAAMGLGEASSLRDKQAAWLGFQQRERVGIRKAGMAVGLLDQARQ